MIDAFLISIGLSDKEVKVYLALLRYGIQPTSVIGKKTGLNRGTTFSVMHALLEKGLVSKSVRNRIQYFSPSPPTSILDYIDHKRDQLTKNRNEAQNMMQRIASMTNQLSSKPSMEFFEGAEGARRVLRTTLTGQNKIIHAFTSLPDLIDSVGMTFLHDYTNQRVAGGYTLRILRTKEKYAKALSQDANAKRFGTSKKEKREVRYAADAMAFPMSMYIFDDKIALISSQEERVAILITSKEFATMQRHLFGILWSASKK